MRKFIIVALLAGCVWGAGAYAGEEPVLEPVEQESQWERFKAGAKEAGSAIATGTKNTAKKAGHAIAEGYEDTRDYLDEKFD